MTKSMEGPRSAAVDMPKNPHDVAVIDRIDALEAAMAPLFGLSTQLTSISEDVDDVQDTLDDWNENGVPIFEEEEEEEEPVVSFAVLNSTAGLTISEDSKVVTLPSGSAGYYNVVWGPQTNYDEAAVTFTLSSPQDSSCAGIYAGWTDQTDLTTPLDAQINSFFYSFSAGTHPMAGATINDGSKGNFSSFTGDTCEGITFKLVHYWNPGNVYFYADDVLLHTQYVAHVYSSRSKFAIIFDGAGEKTITISSIENFETSD